MKPQLFLHFGFQLNVYIVLAVKHLYGYLIGKVFLYDGIQDGKPFIDRYTILVVYTLFVAVLEFFVHKFLRLVRVQLVFKVGRNGRRLDGQQIFLFIYDNTVRRQYLLKFLC